MIGQYDLERLVLLDWICGGRMETPLGKER